MSDARQAAVPSLSLAPLVQCERSCEDGGLVHVHREDAHGTVEAEGLKGGQDCAGADGEDDHVSCGGDGDGG